jgi:hypothetical protein
VLTITWMLDNKGRPYSTWHSATMPTAVAARDGQIQAHPTPPRAARPGFHKAMQRRSREAPGFGEEAHELAPVRRGALHRHN